MTVHSYIFALDWDENGNIQANSFAKPTLLTYTYNWDNKLRKAKWSEDPENSIELKYDPFGNRTKVNVRETTDVNYAVDNLTNRYEKVGDANLTYNAAGGLQIDKDGYTYEYDYENRITKVIKAGPTTVAEFAYDALGRRIKKVDSAAGTTNIYYYNDKWQVLCDYNDSNDLQMWFTYGNYIDEVLTANEGFAGFGYRYYVHDHLYSSVALVRYNGSVLERYEYDAYGNCYILEPNFAPDPDGKSDSGNPYLFTGRRVDILDEGYLKLQYNRNRYYDQYTGRWLTHDPVATVPNSLASNYFTPRHQYSQGLSVYEYALSNPTIGSDPWGLKTWPDLRNQEYKEGTTPPEDSDWEHGRWDRASPPLSLIPTLMTWWHLANWQAHLGWILYPDAAAHLRRYVNNTGGRKTVDFTRMIHEDTYARIGLVECVRNAMTEGERLAPRVAHRDDSGIDIVQKGHTLQQVGADTNWGMAVSTYYIWGQGKNLRKCGCCFYMDLTLNLRDNYEFKNEDRWAGVVKNSWMWELNKYGWAQHFKLRASKDISLTWIKGSADFRKLRYEHWKLLNEGRSPWDFPQCE
ncbi:MAG: hypothetical protein KAY65_06220 [Planctomycetes bacterium]|nr:hypothetical protein [Planctomycetota bacterium]